MKEALDCSTNSPFQHLRKCLENVKEDMHTDVRVERVKKLGLCCGELKHTVHILFSGILIWFVVSELFFGFSANKVYAKALKKVKASAEVRNEKLGLSELYIT